MWSLTNSKWVKCLIYWGSDLTHLALFSSFDNPKKFFSFISLSFLLYDNVLRVLDLYKLPIDLLCLNPFAIFWFFYYFSALLLFFTSSLFFSRWIDYLRSSSEFELLCWGSLISTRLVSVCFLAMKILSCRLSKPSSSSGGSTALGSSIDSSPNLPVSYIWHSGSSSSCSSSTYSMTSLRSFPSVDRLTSPSLFYSGFMKCPDCLRGGVVVGSPSCELGLVGLTVLLALLNFGGGVRGESRVAPLCYEASFFFS